MAMITSVETTCDLTSNNLHIVMEALRQTELMLEDLQATAAAGEQRAFQFATGCLLIATLAATLADQATSSLAVYSGAAGLVGASFWSLWSVRPSHFYIRGHSWNDWKGHIDTNDLLIDVLISQAEENDLRIASNLRALTERARQFNRAMLVAAGSMFLIGFGQLVARTAGG